MTIRDMVEQGIEIQGVVEVQYWDDKNEDAVRLFKSSRRESYINFPDSVMDLEIKYIWARTELEINWEVPVIVIEVEAE